MLSVAAFNCPAENSGGPPAYLIFILANHRMLQQGAATNPLPVPAVRFKRIMPQDIAQRCCYVSARENIALSPDAAETLARLADGPLRDALSLLEQMRRRRGNHRRPRVLDVLGLAGAVQTAQDDGPPAATGTCPGLLT